MTQTTVFSDIDIDLNVQQDGDITRDVDEEAILNSIENIILTIQGTRRMLPEFATSLQKILFEQMDSGTENIIKFKLMDVINKWEPRVVVKNMRIVANYDEAQYNCYFEFHIKGFADNIKTANFIIRRI